jgi:multidrug efflux system outer membrane protein
MKPARGLAACIAAVLAACSLVPVYQRPDPPVSPTYPNAESAPQGGVLAAQIGWRDVFQDARLQGLIEVALRNNRDLRAATLNVEEARALYRVQRSALFPQLDASVSHASSRTALDGAVIQSRLYSAGAAASWEPDIFGARRSASEAALQRFFASAYGRRAAHILLVSQVANQYLAILADDELLQVTRDTLATARSSYGLSKAQFEGGVGNELSLRQAEGVLRQAEANYTAQQRLRTQDENTLVLLLGSSLPQDLPPAVPLGSQAILADVPAGLPSELLTRRPDVLQAEAVLRGANADIGAARAAFFPSISLTGSVGTVSPELHSLFRSNTREWSFVPSIVLPIFHGGELRASLDAAKIEKDVRIAQYEKVIQAAFMDVANGLAARGTYNEQVAALERYVAAEQVALKLSLERFRAGIDSYLNVLTAQNALYGAQQALVQARLGRLANRVSLYQALGGGWLERTGDVAPGPEDIALAASTK